MTIWSEAPPSAVQESRLVLRLTPSDVEAGTPTVVAPGTFIGILQSGGLGQPSHVISLGAVPDTIVMEYNATGACYVRTWTATAHEGAECVFQLASDTSTTGYVNTGG